MNMKCLFKECALDDKDGRVTPPPETDGRQKIVHTEQGERSDQKRWTED